MSPMCEMEEVAFMVEREPLKVSLMVQEVTLMVQKGLLVVRGRRGASTGARVASGEGRGAHQAEEAPQGAPGGASRYVLGGVSGQGGVS